MQRLYTLIIGVPIFCRVAVVAEFIFHPLQNKQHLEESMTTTVINKGTSPIKFNAGAVGSDITH